MAMTLLTTNTGSGVTASAFTSGIDSTYKLYVFKFYEVNPAADGSNFQFQANAAGASGYNETITSSFFAARHNEDDSTTEGPSAVAAYDQAQGTDGQYLTADAANDADASVAGEFFLFNPSNTTYVKHWQARTNAMNDGGMSYATFVSGYFNTTTAIDDIKFFLEGGGAFDAVIKMYGVG